MQDSDRPTNPSSRAPDREARARIWTDWPRCACCGRPRLTVCPTCGMAGDQFVLAEYLAPAAPLRHSRGQTPGPLERDDAALEILLVCPQCDEAFAPRFYRRCPQCGHDEGAGLDVQPWDVEPLSATTLSLLCGLSGLVALIVWYFRWLFG